MEIKIKDLGEITTGNTPSKKDDSYWESADICFVKPDGIADEGITLINSSTDFISGKARDKARIVSKDAVFVTCIGSIGKIGIADSGDYAFNQQINVIEPNEIVMPRYLAYNLLFSKPRLISIANAAVVPIINKTQFGEIVINIEEDKTKQVEIVSVLDKLSGIITKYKQELKSLDVLIKARFVEMFGDPVSNPFGLPVKKLSELGSLDRGRSQHRPRNAPELLGGPYPLIQTGEVSVAGLYITEYHNTYSEIGLKQSKMWKAGTLCITIAANIAQTAIMTFDACFPDSVVGFVPYGEVNALYIHYWFGFFQKILEEQAPQVAQKNINLKILSDLNVIVPEKKKLKQFEDFVARVDKSKVAVQKSLDETQLLFDSLMQEYFG